MSCGICNYSYTDCECTEDMHRAYNSGIEAGEAISSDTIAHLTAELAEAREKNGTLIEKINAKRPRLESNHDYSRGWNDACFAISQIDPDATAALAARDKRVREEAFRNGHSRGRTRNIVNEDEDVANYLARLDQHK